MLYVQSSMSNVSVNEKINKEDFLERKKDRWRSSEKPKSRYYMGSTDTFSRTTRAENIIEKAKALCIAKNQRENKADAEMPVLRELIIATPAAIKNEANFSFASPTKSSIVKKVLNGNSVSFDSVFCDDSQENNWTKTFRNKHLRRLSYEINLDMKLQQQQSNKNNLSEPSELLMNETPSRNSLQSSLPLLNINTQEDNTGEYDEDADGNDYLDEAEDPNKLPPIINSPIRQAKYFGTSAKSQFFQTYKEIYKQRNQLLHGENDIINALQHDKAAVRHLNPLAETPVHLQHLPQSYSPTSRNYSNYNYNNNGQTMHQKGDENEIDNETEDSEATLRLTKQDSDDVSAITEAILPTGFTSSRLSTRNANSASTSAKHKRNNNRIFMHTSQRSINSQSTTSNTGTTAASEASALSLISVSSTYSHSSPRAKFLAGCLKNKVPPRSSIMLRNRHSNVLNLEHQGIGDTFAELLAAGLNSMPNVEVLSVADNNLTDSGLKALIDSISHNYYIVEIDLSGNKVGPEAAASLGRYLGRADCRLKKLKMSSADVDDSECFNLTHSLSINSSLEELDLSNNLLGKDENLNIVKPDTVTAGESLALLLKNPQCPLKILKISWNMIRMQGAFDLCSSLATCPVLTYLDLSFNALDTEAGITLGESLHENKVLKHLLVAQNAFGPKACVCICVGIRLSRSLEHVSLDGNVVGEAGAQALVAIPLLHPHDLLVTTNGCNLTMKDSSCWFNQRDPEGIHNIDLSDGYSRAILFEILRLVAWDPTYALSVFDYSEDGSGRSWEKLSVGRCTRSVEDTLSDSDKRLIAGQKTLLEMCDSMEKMRSFFERYKDVIGDGVTKAMFHDVLVALGLVESSARKIGIAFDMFDSDKSGFLEFDEFVAFLTQCRKNADVYISDISRTLYMAETKSELKEYVPPKKGKVKLKVTNLRFRGVIRRHAITPNQVNRLITYANNSSDPDSLFLYATESVEIHLFEAISLYDSMLRGLGNAINVLPIMLPQMSKVKESKQMLDIFIADDLAQIKLLKNKLGNAYKPLLGCYSGYYMLDLREKNDRICFAKLLEYSNTLAYSRKVSGLADISQDGNWSSFRNCMINGKRGRIDSCIYDMMPAHGHIEFDFVDSFREADYEEMVALTDKFIVEFMLHLHLIPQEQTEWSFLRLQEWKDAMNDGLITIGKCYWRCDTPRACVIGDYIRKTFSVKLPERAGQVAEVMKKERTVRNEPDSNARSEINTRGGARTKSSSSLIPAASVNNLNVNTNLSDASEDELSSVGANGSNGIGLSTLSPPLSISIPRSMSNTALVQNNSIIDKLNSNGSSNSNSNNNSSTNNINVARKGSKADLLDSHSTKITPSRRLSNAKEHLANTFGDEISVIELLERADSMEAEDVSKSAAMNHKNKRTHTTVLLRQSSQTKMKRILELYEKKMFEKAEKFALNSLKVSNGKSRRKSYNHLLLPSSAVCIQLIEFLDHMLSSSYILCRHLALLLECFPGRSMRRTDFGSYSVELVIALFSRIKDLHNFELIFSVLEPEEQAVLYVRLGFLVLYNPIKPDGSIRLDLSVWEQRQITKIMFHLSLAEPGENWVGETYSSDPDLPPMPGWEVSVVWLTEEGLPRFGKLTSTYFSGNGLNEDGCVPDVLLRHKLCSIVLIRSSDIRPEQVDLPKKNNHQVSFIVHEPANISVVNSLLKNIPGKNVSWNYEYSMVKNIVIPGFN